MTDSRQDTCHSRGRAGTRHRRTQSSSTIPVGSQSSSGPALGHFLPSQCEQPSLAAQKEIGFFPALQLLWFLLGAGNEALEPGGRLICHGWSLHPCSWQPAQEKIRGDT